MRWGATVALGCRSRALDRLHCRALRLGPMAPTPRTRSVPSAGPRGPQTRCPDCFSGSAEEGNTLVAARLACLRPAEVRDGSRISRSRSIATLFARLGRGSAKRLNSRPHDIWCLST